MAEPQTYRRGQWVGEGVPWWRVNPRGDDPTTWPGINMLYGPSASAMDVLGDVAGGAVRGLQSFAQGGPLIGVPQAQTQAPAAESTGDVFGLALERQTSGGGDRYAVNRALQGRVASIFPNAVFSGGAGQVRDPEDYARLRAQGAPAARNSRHETGEATDFQIPGMGANDLPQVRAMARSAGIPFEDIIYHNNHFHLELPRGAGQQLFGSPQQRIVDQGQALGRDIFASIDPRLAAAMVPDPIALQGVTLPDAPQRALPQDLPMYEAANKDVLLADLIAASQVPERDASNDPWERIQALLMGAAGGAAGAGPNDDFGTLLLRAGGGGIGAFRGEREQQRALDLEQDREARQMAQMLANAGLELDLSALGTRNTNLDRGWQSGENRADVGFQNETSIFNRGLQQANMDLGVRQFNVGAQNQARSQRGQVALGALEGGVNAQNQGTQLGIQLAAAAAAPDPRQADAVIANAIRTAGVPENDQTLAVGRAIAAKNSAALMPHLATSLLTSGGYATALNEDDAAKVQQYVQQEQPEMALAIVQQALAATAQQADGQTIIGSLVDDLASQGDPVGILIRGARGGQ